MFSKGEAYVFENVGAYNEVSYKINSQRGSMISRY
jgi:hypothetical protein